MGLHSGDNIEYGMDHNAVLVHVEVFSKLLDDISLALFQCAADVVSLMPAVKMMPALT